MRSRGEPQGDMQGVRSRGGCCGALGECRARHAPGGRGGADDQRQGQGDVQARAMTPAAGAVGTSRDDQLDGGGGVVAEHSNQKSHFALDHRVCKACGGPSGRPCRSIR